MRGISVEVAESAGYCFGVRRAINLALESAPSYTLGPLIHNSHAVDELKSKGVIPCDDIEELPEGARVVIRSHGVDEATYLRLKRDFEVIDATCPFVDAIHKTVKQAAAQGIPVIVAGQREHPEVRGIVGWTGGQAYVIANEEEAAGLPRMRTALIVAQTTMGLGRFEQICQSLRSVISEPIIKNTVCSATQTRQAETEALAKKSDVMLVVGDTQSANTRRLYEIAAQYCPHTYLIDSVSSLNNITIKADSHIGITAGASTPSSKFEEVCVHMNNINQNNSNELDFASMVDESMVQIRPGQILTGSVLSVNPDEVSVSVGYKSDGLIKAEDLSDKNVKPGDEIEVEVVKVNDGEGNVILSQRGIIARKVWDDLETKKENGEIIQAVAKQIAYKKIKNENGEVVTDTTKGSGIICNYSDGITVFVPAGQVASRYVEKLDDFIGKTLDLKITDIDRAKKRLVASRRAVLAEEAEKRKAENEAKKKAIWDQFNEGDVVKGTVRRLTDFGAFVDIGGVDGLVHVTNLSFKRVFNPAEVVKPGDVIDVKILKLDYEKDRISLSRKDTLTDPWTTAVEKYPVDSIIEGTVVRITTFGAFVNLEEGLDGLIYISECSNERVNKVEDAVKVGDNVRVKVLKVDPEKQRISLSIKQAQLDEAFEGGETDIADEYAIDENEEPAEGEAN